MESKFIVVEGIDGSGTTTISEYLSEKMLTYTGVKTVLTNEPSGFEIGILIRKILRGEKRVKSDLSMLYLFIADRCEHIDRVIIPAINSGKHVVCDRNYFSTLVYQPFVSFDQYKALPGFLEPDLIIYLDVSPKNAMERIESRGGKKELYEKLEKQIEIRKEYEKVFKSYKEKNNFIKIDANLSLSLVKSFAWNFVKNFVK